MRLTTAISVSIVAMVAITACDSTTTEVKFDPKSIATQHMWYQKDTCKNSPYNSFEFSDEYYRQVLYADESYTDKTDGLEAKITAWTEAGIDILRKEGGEEGELVCNITDDLNADNDDPDWITIDCNPLKENSPIDGFIRTIWKTKLLANAHPNSTCD